VAGGLSADPLLAENRRFYDALWTGAELIGPERFNTWPLIQALAAEPGLRLEAGAGLRPRLPLPGTVFADISLPALRSLRAAGGRAAAGLVTALPFADAVFRLVCALDIVEHVGDDQAAFAELARVSAPGAVLLLSVPLHQAAWTAFDDAVGHHRRYDPLRLIECLAAVGFTVEQSAPSGMLPRSSRLKNAGMWFLRRQPAQAMWWYNRVFMPIGLKRAPALDLRPGMIATDGVAGVLLLCRKVQGHPPSGACHGL
jgi:SAM-dependent methyltransferase